MPHHGEEPPVSGYKGSGTIFFSYCNLRCVYCQNYQFSQKEEGQEISIETLSEYMINLQNLGCHNINLVTPTHFMPQILKSLYLATQKGLNIPLVYNTSGYELPGIIKMFDDIIDIYLTDMRYGDNQNSIKYSQAPDYADYNQEAVKEMYKQVPESTFDENGIIKKGLIIRHLVLPENIAGTEKIMKFISENLSKKIYISLMSQYQPYYQAHKYQELSRRITQEEYQEAIDCLNKYGLENGWVQDSRGLERFAGIHIKRNT
jgi:putative pyruvate formate lyase activating enzyme